MQALGLFGGTFDPIHFGHLGAAADVHASCQLASVVFVPAANPPLRDTPIASAEQRLEMVELAVAGDVRFSVDSRELESSGPSYSVTTLESFHADHGDVSLYLIIGIDAFLNIEKWYQWERLFELAHLVIMQRPEFKSLQELKLGNWLMSKCRSNFGDLAAVRYGYIYFCNVGPYKISGSEIRRRIVSGVSVSKMVPPEVLSYIKETGLYQGQ